MSTLFADRARRDGRLATRLISIDPLPRDEVAGATDELLPARIEDTDLSAFAGLQAGDVILFDGSHRATMGSDVVVFHLEVLPALPPGVLVGVHDVMLPDDYLPELAEWRWSEQYLVAALLLAGAPFVRPVLPAWHASTTPQVVAPLFEGPRLAGMDRRGVALWLETVAS